VAEPVAIKGADDRRVLGGSIGGIEFGGVRGFSAGEKEAPALQSEAGRAGVVVGQLPDGPGGGLDAIDRGPAVGLCNEIEVAAIVGPGEAAGGAVEGDIDRGCIAGEGLEIQLRYGNERNRADLVGHPGAIRAETGAVEDLAFFAEHLVQVRAIAVGEPDLRFEGAVGVFGAVDMGGETKDLAVGRIVCGVIIVKTVRDLGGCGARRQRLEEPVGEGAFGIDLHFILEIELVHHLRFFIGDIVVEPCPDLGDVPVRVRLSCRWMQIGIGGEAGFFVGPGGNCMAGVEQGIPDQLANVDAGREEDLFAVG
jgi:hypothetical protein